MNTPITYGHIVMVAAIILFLIMSYASGRFVYDNGYTAGVESVPVHDGYCDAGSTLIGSSTTTDDAGLYRINTIECDKNDGTLLFFTTTK